MFLTKTGITMRASHFFTTPVKNASRRISSSPTSPHLRACSVSGGRRTHRRLFIATPQTRAASSSSAATAEEAAAQLRERIRSDGGSITRHQILDGNQLQKLCITLGRSKLNNEAQDDGDHHRRPEISSFEPPEVGAAVPPGYHLVYFTPLDFEDSLGPDGSDRAFNPPPPFVRRMWAGGQMMWSEQKLRVGDRVREVTKLGGVTVKKSRSGDEMVLVEVDKEYYAPNGVLSLSDRRSWIFRRLAPDHHQGGQPLPHDPSAAALTNEEPPTPLNFSKTSITDRQVDDGKRLQRQFTLSPVTLFRFSALTFNAHMIHYNQPWTRLKEGHPEVVVHGPLNLVNVLDFWRDCASRGLVDGIPAGAQTVPPCRRVKYRAVAPIYAGESFYMEIMPQPQPQPHDSNDSHTASGDSDQRGPARFGTSTVLVKKKKKKNGQVHGNDNDLVCMTAEISWKMPEGQE